MAYESMALGEQAQVVGVAPPHVDPVLGRELEEFDGLGDPGFQGGDEIAPKSEPRASQTRDVWHG
jgi:hypothetical protein